MLVRVFLTKQNDAPARAPFAWWSLGMIKSVDIVDIHEMRNEIEGKSPYSYNVKLENNVVRVHVTADIHYTVLRYMTIKERKRYLLEAISMLRPLDDLKNKITQEIIEILNEFALNEVFIEELKSYDYIIPAFLMRLDADILYALYCVVEDNDSMKITTYAGIRNTYIKTREVTKTPEEFCDAITKLSKEIFIKRQKAMFNLLDKNIRGICPITILKALFHVKPFNAQVDNYHPFLFELERQVYLPIFIWPDTLSRAVYEIITTHSGIEYSSKKLIEVANSFLERLERMNEEEIREVAFAIFQKDMKKMRIDIIKEVLKESFHSLEV